MTNEKENTFKQIKEINDPSLLTNVASLRFYIKNYGYTNALNSYLKLTNEQIYKITKYAYGKTLIDDLIKNYDSMMEEFEENYKIMEKTHKKDNFNIEEMKTWRTNFGNIGSKKAKLYLNKQIKEGNLKATILRKLIEAEDEILKSQDNFFYADFHMNNFVDLINEIIKLYETNKLNLNYGYEDTINEKEMHLLIFNLPNKDKIIYHLTLSDLNGLKKYGEPIKHEDETIPNYKKLEKYFLEIYKEKIEDVPF